MSNFMTTHPTKYGSSFRRITTLSISFRTSYQRTTGAAYEYYYPDQLPGRTHLFSPLCCERGTIWRFRDASGKDKSMGGWCVFSSPRCSQKAGGLDWFGAGLCGVQLSRFSHSRPWDLSISVLFCCWPHFLFGVVSPPSALNHSLVIKGWLFPCST